MFNIVTSEVPKILDLKSFQPKIDTTDIVFIFGNRAAKICKGMNASIEVFFPNLSKLDAVTGDQTERTLAYSKLLDLKKEIDFKLLKKDSDNDLILQEVKEKILGKSLPELDSKQVLALESILKQKGIKSWECKGKDGTNIRITIEPEKGNADINITFQELYALKSCIETLHVEEFGIVYKSLASDSKNNS
jgi:hypothetical protein